MKQRIVKPSEFFGGLFLLTSTLCLILSEVSDNSFAIIASFITFIIGCLIWFNKSISNKIDYEKEGKQ